jgi:aspartyl-tRNA(Asn)/glutamyl-tRNA(Gln) amidotransferase subunit C
VSVSPTDVRHIAALARLDIPVQDLAALAAELSGILRHMEALAKVDTSDVDPVHGVGTGGMRLREDDGPQYPLARRLDEFAPAMRDGFFVVPRLDSHATREGGEAA